MPQPMSKEEGRAGMLALRPEIPSIDPHLSSNPAEQFQNQTLRPVLKLQNPLLVAIFHHYLLQKGLDWAAMQAGARQDYIRQALQGDAALRNTLHGIVIGQFSLDEWTQFAAQEKELRKRCTQMLIQRLQDQVG